MYIQLCIYIYIYTYVYALHPIRPARTWIVWCSKKPIISIIIIIISGVIVPGKTEKATPFWGERVNPSRFLVSTIQLSIEKGKPPSFSTQNA